jgi:spore maturation protein CgeE
MMTKNQIIDMEIKYIKLFSKQVKYPFGYAFYDEKQRDKYFHNYLHILRNEYSLRELNLYYMDTSKHGFVLYRVEEGIEITHNPIFSGYIHDHDAYYANDINHIEIHSKINAEIHQVDPKKDQHFFDFLYQEDLLFGTSYAEGNVKRQKEVLTQFKNYIYFYIKHEDRIIGHINCFIDQNYAKIDEFYIVEAYQKHGYGSSLMKHMIDYLKKKDVNEVYLVTDLSDTAKTLYERWNFKFVADFHFFRKMIEEKKD